jgi:hypothetical protein
VDHVDFIPQWGVEFKIISNHLKLKKEDDKSTHLEEFA